MASFSFNTAAELFPAAIRKKKLAGFAYRRFGTAAKRPLRDRGTAGGFAEWPYLQVDEARFEDQAASARCMRVRIFRCRAAARA
jgi:hypothetical protein